MGLEYMRQFPQSVRRLVIDGVVPPSFDMMNDAQASFDDLLKACASDEKCNHAYPDLQKRWNQLLNKMPQKISMPHPRLGTKITVDLTRDAMIGILFKSLYSPQLSSALPLAITQAEQGNFVPFITISGVYNLPSPMGISQGMHFSVMCGEIMADPNRRKQAATNDLDKVMANLYEKVCPAWPLASIPPEFYTVPVSPAPVLLLSGGIDPVTPTHHASSVAKMLGDKTRMLTVQNNGHGLLGYGCVRDVVYRYLNASDDAAALAVDAKCVREIPRPTFWKLPVPSVAEQAGVMP